ncbi:MAG: arsenosugar biosynthesis radical SAM protein ArsS [Acidobacteriaceae bacterium]|nr:arsenosugar biosynthesis radical SAM protein ArsS [Acidobacteriaceae bacterium]
MAAVRADFGGTLRRSGLPLLRRAQVTTVQINVGKVCNQACQHCHVDAGPKRTESMSRETADRVLTLLSRSQQPTIADITGGAPELNLWFRHLVEQCRAQGLHVIDRCNLTILLEPGHETLADFLAGHQVEITASLPCYTRENVDRQRGRGVFDKSIQALQLLNRIGYGISDELPLNLVYNPLGPSLPPRQPALEMDYKRHLLEDFGIRFNRLLTITNMPISRFAEFLTRTGKLEFYSSLLADNFNAATVNHLMCRSLISVGWDGKLYDCDFNQMLEIPIPRRLTIWDIESFDEMAERHIATANHCFGCTAGAGSSCGGTLVGP